MKLRKPNIDASSIADIAFLLLAFIMIATTLEKEEGIPAVLPEKSSHPSPPIIVKDRNVLEIFINKENNIQIEEEVHQSLSDVKFAVKLFMTNPQKIETLPTMVEMSKEICKQNLYKLKQLEHNRHFSNSRELKKWERRLEAVNLVGSYETLNKAAVISIKYDKSTSYGAYLEIRDHILQGINELRNELALKKFGISFTQLQSIRIQVKSESQIAMQRAIREVYPQKIIKLEALEN